MLISAFFLGGVFVLIKYLTSREHILTIINHFMMVSMVGGLLFFPYWRMPTADEMPYALLVGVCGMIGQLCMTRAFQLEDSSFLAPFKYFELVFALILGFLFFGDRYSLIPLLGMSLIILGMIFNVVSKAASKRGKV